MPTPAPDKAAQATDDAAPVSSPDLETSRVTRLLCIVREIRQNPRQPLDELWKRLGISRSQFYKDKDALEGVGFQFDYSKKSGFRIVEDRLMPITGLSLSDRLVLMFALEHLCTAGDGTLAALAVELGRKLAGGLESPFRERLQASFDLQVVNNAYGVKQEILSFLREAIQNGERICMEYERAKDWTVRTRIVDPRHIYMRQRNLYLYARTADESPCWKVFRISRIRKIEKTGISMKVNPHEDDGFLQKQSNAFMAFMGPDARRIRLRFTGTARRLVQEQQWHPSQILEEQRDGSLLFTVTVAEPLEVVRWARQFANEAEVLEIEDNEDECGVPIA